MAAVQVAVKWPYIHGIVQLRGAHLASRDRDKVDLASGGAHCYDGRHDQLICWPCASLACRACFRHVIFALGTTQAVGNTSEVR